MAGILLIGGGGHCRAVLDALPDAYGRRGIVDAARRVGDSVDGVSVVGTDADLARLFGAYTHAFVAFGGVGLWRRRAEAAERLAEIGFALPVIAHASAVISRHAQIGRGAFVAARAAVNAGAAVEEGAIVNTGAIVEHDCRVGAYAHIAPGAVLCGHVTVGRGAHIGAGAVVRQGAAIGEGAVVGAGAVVTRDIPPDVTAYGNPCKVVGGH